MKRPKLSDHTASGIDYSRYIKALNDYIDFLESEYSSNYDIPETVKRRYKEFRENTNYE